MPHLVVHLVRRGDGLLDLIPDEVAELTPQSMHGHLDAPSDIPSGAPATV